jgi:hypothetical protein
MIDRSLLFRIAWDNAKASVAMGGGSLREMFARCLRSAWKNAKDKAARAAAAPVVKALAAPVPALSAGLRAAARRGWRRQAVGFREVKGHLLPPWL